MSLRACTWILGTLHENPKSRCSLMALVHVVLSVPCWRSDRRVGASSKDHALIGNGRSRGIMLDDDGLPGPTSTKAIDAAIRHLYAHSEARTSPT